MSNFRIPKHIVQAAKEKAAAEGRTLTDVIVAYLRRYISTPPRKKDDEQGGQPQPSPQSSQR